MPPTDVLSTTPFTIGVFVSSWYAELLGWRYLFYTDVVVGLLAAGFVSALFYGRGFQARIVRFDFVGVVLLTALAYAAQTIFNMGDDFDWFASPILQERSRTSTVLLRSWRMAIIGPARTKIRR